MVISGTRDMQVFGGEHELGKSGELSHVVGSLQNQIQGNTKESALEHSAQNSSANGPTSETLRILYTYFLEDPWIETGVQGSVREGVLVRRSSCFSSVPGGEEELPAVKGHCGHCADFHEQQEYDPTALNMARNEIDDLVGQWLREAAHVRR